MTTLGQLSYDSFYNMNEYSQITIDFIQELEDILSGEYFGEREKEYVLLALSYTISTVLDIINPALKTDKEGLLKLIEIIEKCIEN